MRKQLGAIVGGLLILTACSGEEEAGGTMISKTLQSEQQQDPIATCYHQPSSQA
ncbi:hypothetical protein [Geomicrobium sp. JCM 19055]|uniref:hypothetical protein n=1 Tax=Geomicrobium sp. JCM 19055 TaxID=1460649 RepID=UPI0026D75D46